MGVRTTLLGVTLTAGDITQAETLGTDIKGCMALAELKCQEVIVLLNYLVNDVLTPAGDTANASTLTAQVTALT